MSEINPWFKDREEYLMHWMKITNPKLWPKGVHPPVLCLKNPTRIARGENDQFARIMSDGNGSYWFSILGTDHVSNEPWSTDKIMENGWVVD